jgi:hypothetical protein
VKPQWVRCKLGETIKHPSSDVLANTREVCKGARLYNGYPASMDDHDLWGMCTTSIESRTIMTTMLTVKSGMDPNMISGNMGWVLVKSWLGCVKVGFIRLRVGHGETP